MSDTALKPAERLTGLTLEGGWKVTTRQNRGPSSTGGCFSIGYFVEHESGRKAFLKALDFSRALTSPDPARAIQSLTESYNFERDVLRLCRDKRLDRVATAIAEGTVRIPGSGDAGAVPYLIFELADGDVRSQIDFSKRFDIALRLRALHHISTGLWQLHKQTIAHQDLKPSNVLVFNNDESRITDLGRAAVQGKTPPHDNCIVPGDPSYAPPELMYNHTSDSWFIRRQGCDLYHLGSMIVFFFAGTAMTPELLKEIPTSHHPWNWTGTYPEVLPVVRKAFGDVIEQLKSAIEPEYREVLTDLIIQLCDPDLGRRGYPKARGNSAMQYSLERYVSKFDLIATKAEFSFRKKV
ncbi:protein kinase [Geothrix sp. PMB-07]|uniref:protein kinase domain-containing protein n=1 Tax=Geothrix sp. PMB-07 TaxID=3068640 RepID=UPI002742071C|nr:protein kinase [Geothrix sp. PMB-07]WLT32764.1 protein kinase [Geothrix sp. PMB-07]